MSITNKQEMARAFKELMGKTIVVITSPNHTVGTYKPFCTNQFFYIKGATVQVRKILYANASGVQFSILSEKMINSMDINTYVTNWFEKNVIPNMVCNNPSKQGELENNLREDFRIQLEEKQIISKREKHDVVYCTYPKVAEIGFLADNTVTMYGVSYFLVDMSQEITNTEVV